jgi:hypothetical protein
MSILYENDKKDFQIFVVNSRKWFDSDNEIANFDKSDNISTLGDKIQELYS